MHTDTSISENAANSSQISGIQTFAIANSVANSTANKCKQHNSPKTVNSANRLNALENIGQMGENGKFSVQQCSHAGEVNDYAIHNSGMVAGPLLGLK